MALSPFSATWRTDIVNLFASIQSTITTLVVGPASATDEAIARFNLTTGKLIQNSTATLSDTGAATFPARLTTKMLNLGAAASKTIASGVITLTETDSSRVSVDTQGGAATDDLDTINGGVVGDIIILRTTAAARDVTVKSGTGNIILAGGVDFTLINLGSNIGLELSGSNWRELWRTT